MALSKTDIENLRKKVSGDPSCDELYQLVVALSEHPATRAEARELCLRGLAENPHNHVIRLVLARLYYLDKLGEFSVRELLELKRRAGGSLPTLDKLLGAFGEYANQFTQQTQSRTATSTAPSSEHRSLAARQDPKVVAELDLDADFTDLLEDLEDDGSAH